MLKSKNLNKSVPRWVTVELVGDELLLDCLHCSFSATKISGLTKEERDFALCDFLRYHRRHKKRIGCKQPCCRQPASPDPGPVEQIVIGVTR